MCVSGQTEGEPGDLLPIVFPEGHDVVSSKFKALLYETLEGVQDGYYVEAIPKLERIIEEDPAIITAWESLGWCYWETGRREDAIKLWKELIVIDPELPLPYALLAIDATTQRDFAGAIEYYEKSLEINPNQYEVRLNLARVLQWAGNPDDSIEILSDLLEQDPDRTDVVLELARVLLRSREEQRALPLWSRLRGVATNNTEFLASEAICMLHSGKPVAAVERARECLEIDEDNLVALDVLATAAEYGETPSTALPFLRRMLKLHEAPVWREFTRSRIVRLSIRLHRNEPLKHSLLEAIALSREQLAEDSDCVDALLLLGELLLIDRQPVEAQGFFTKALRDHNPHNLRAKTGLLEVYLLVRQFDKARDMLRQIEQFNPRDPYRFYYLARLESARGLLYRAYVAAQELNAEGIRGAVPVLVYDGLSRSRYSGETVPVVTFREHMAVLKAAGFRFMIPAELPEYFRRQEPTAGSFRAVATRPAVIVTLDGADLLSMRLATEVAQELDIVLTAHVALQRDSDADELSKLLRTGCWAVGSYVKDGGILASIDADGRQGHPLPNRLPRADEMIVETYSEYETRLHGEFDGSHATLCRKLGIRTVVSVAYPFGDVGQLSYSNVDDPVRRITGAAAAAYNTGFIQSPFGFAVNGDNPLLYQRHKVERWLSGQQLVDRIYENHPVFRSFSLRAMFSAFQGKLYRARRILKRLGELNYPKQHLLKLTKEVEDRLARRLSAPIGAGGGEESPFRIRLRSPYAAARGNYFDDNQGRQTWWVSGAAGLNVTRGLAIEGQAGSGELKEDTSAGGTDISISERNLGIKAIYTFPYGRYVSCEGVGREYSSPADRVDTGYAFEAQIRPLLPLDTRLRFEHDTVPLARAVAADIQHDLFLVETSLQVRDWWNLLARGLLYDFSDNNEREQYLLESKWLVWERTGMFAGVRYSYVSADERRDSYWSPFELNRYLFAAGFRGSYLRAYYNIEFRYGRGKQGVHPEVEDAYRQHLALANEQGFDPNAPPKEEWEPVYSATAATRIPTRKHWAFNVAVSYSKTPDYQEFNALTGIRYAF